MPDNFHTLPYYDVKDENEIFLNNYLYKDILYEMFNEAYIPKVYLIKYTE